MSLRGSETTEAISQEIDISEIATLLSVARNDRKGITTQSLRGEGRQPVTITFGREGGSDEN